MTTETATVAFCRLELLAWPTHGRDGGLVQDAGGCDLGVLGVDLPVDVAVLDIDLEAVGLGDGPAGSNPFALGADAGAVGFGRGLCFGQNECAGSGHRHHLSRR